MSASGKFRGVSETELLELVAKGGHDVSPDGEQSEFVRRGLSAIARSEAAGDWIPVDQVIAKLEAKIAVAQDRRKMPKG
jgi:hypothetical protein